MFKATLIPDSSFFIRGCNLARSVTHQQEFPISSAAWIVEEDRRFNLRGFLVPWSLSAVVMYGLSYLWHGVILRDFHELTIPVGLYLALAGLVYLIIGAVLTVAVHQAIIHEWVNLKKAFPLHAMLIGAIVGFVVYLFVFILGLSFADHAVIHVVVDILWQMVEQALGGLMVSLGIIYDMHRRFMEAERA
ncbi:MAG: hypothetical protein KDB88_12090 [Flavobacteriales bacterium]|nr:hypothetical protein [Flavobacteriales bacterium]